MRLSSLLAAAALALAGASVARTPAPLLPSIAAGAADPFAWLEHIHGARAMDWVARENARTAGVLESDPRFEPFRRQALAIFTAADRIPMPAFLGDGVANLWQDGEHPHGLWRVTSRQDYRTAAPHWRVLIDLDALSKAEGKSWFFKGADCLAPEDRICLVRLSDGGGDAVELREFDTRAGGFTPGGLRFARSKQEAEWIDADTLLLASDFGPGSLTTSGYPRSVRLVHRGEDLAHAKVVFEGSPTDVRAGSRVIRDASGAIIQVVVDQGLDFYHTRRFAMDRSGSVRPLDLPAKSELAGKLAGRLILVLKQDWKGFSAGDLVSVDPDSNQASVILRPTSSQTIERAGVGGGRLFVQMLDNVAGAVEVLTPATGAWTRRRLALPGGSTLGVEAIDRSTGAAFLTSENFLEPTALWELRADAGPDPEKIKAAPARFDASGHVAEQRFATSADGTRIPYFLVRPKGMQADGATPVQMFGYGGFDLSETPVYRPEMGKLWLERGGAYVVANIRGGGEFGPSWHEAALREHRQRAFDDFAAVARDLIRTGVTSPRHLGIYGRSNGGVLMSVSMTQHPELYGAVVIESPLIDMLRYSHLTAGASWMAEYGDPDVAGDRAFIERYSAYTQLKPGVRYPRPYITTNTEDDRVHPSHARKFAAELEALGKPMLYYENTFGGHANDADPGLNARRWARHYVYLTQQLMD